LRIGFRWLDDDESNGFVDLFNPELFKNGVSRLPIQHEVLQPNNLIFGIARCLLTVEGHNVYLDYEPFSKWNSKRDILLGVTCFTYNEKTNPPITNLTWKKKGDHIGCSCEFVYVSRPDEICTLNGTNEVFEIQLSEALKMPESERQGLLPVVGNVPVRVTVSSKVFLRNLYVMAECLRRAQGTCQKCGAKAPFIRANGEPYLEVHHVVPLSKGGTDDLKNTIAICPNCHRELHYGATCVTEYFEAR
jgi:hypothetical protein